MKRNKIYSKLRFLLYISIMVFVTSCQEFGNPIEIPTESLTLRQIGGNYYQNTNFTLGTTVQYKYLSNSTLYPVYAAEFKSSAPDSVFSQSEVYPVIGGGWYGDRYRRFFTDSRRQGQFLKANTAISSFCSKSVKDDNISSIDLEAYLNYYLKNAATEIEANKDVVKWMEVVSNPITLTNVSGLGYNRSSTTNTVTYTAGSFLGPVAGIDGVESPWAYLGFESINVQGSPFEMPVYIGKAFTIANQYAPNVKKLIVQDMDNMNPAIWNNLKKSILALRSKGIRVNGLGWTGSVSLGWEKNNQNIQQLSLLVDWCYLNNIEFFITGLEVKVSNKNNDLDMVSATRQEQAETFNAIVKIMATKAGKGASGIWFGLFNGKSANGQTMGNLFDISGQKTIVHQSVSSILINKQ